MDTQQIYTAINQRRVEQGLTQEDVGKRANVSRELMSRLKNGSNDIGLRRLIRICDALGMEVIVRPGRGRPVFEDLDGLFEEKT